MRRLYGDYNADVFKRLKDHFIHNDVTFEQLSLRSVEICGQQVAVDRIKEIAGREAWKVTKNTVQFSQSQDVGDEVNRIRQIIFEQIIAAHEGGLLVVGQVDETEVEAALAKLDVKIVRVYPGNVEAGLVNAYMNLLDKSGVNPNMSGVSAKPSREQVLDAIREGKRAVSQ